MSEKRAPSTTILILVSIVVISLVAVMVGGVVWWIHWHTVETTITADVCAAVVELTPKHFVHLEVVRGYNEFWDQQIGTDILVESGNPDLKIGDRLTLTARTLWGRWDIDWAPYEDCPEAFSRTVTP